MPVLYGGPGVLPGLGALPGLTTEKSLGPGEVWMIPNGWFEIVLGYYTTIQCLDAITGTWLGVGSAGYTGSSQRVRSDGFNYRVANQTGCAVGAILTAAGANYTSPPTVTPSAGGSRWTAVMGQSVASATITNGGSGYTYAPVVIFGPPAFPGIQATGHATVSVAGVVNGIIIDNQGAGYTTTPSITLTPDPRSPAGAGAAATAVMTGAGSVNGVVCNDHGNPLTATPTLSIAGGGGSGATATAVMHYTVTGITVAGGTGYPAGSLQVLSAFAATQPAGVRTNPWMQERLVRGRPAIVGMPVGVFGGSGTAGVPIAGVQVPKDGGIYDSVPTAAIWSNLNSTANPTAVATFTVAVGGVVDTFRVFPG